jgi:hypothetical protein
MHRLQDDSRGSKITEQKGRKKKSPGQGKGTGIEYLRQAIIAKAHARRVLQVDDAGDGRGKAAANPNSTKAKGDSR